MRSPSPAFPLAVPSISLLKCYLKQASTDSMGGSPLQDLDKVHGIWPVKCVDKRLQTAKPFSLMPGQQVAMQRPQEHAMNQPFLSGQRLWGRAPTCHNHPALGPTVSPMSHTGSGLRARAAFPLSQTDELPKASSSTLQNSPAVYTFGSSELCILPYPSA